LPVTTSKEESISNMKSTAPCRLMSNEKILKNKMNLSNVQAHQ